MMRNEEVYPTTEFPPSAQRFMLSVLPVPPIQIRPPLTIGGSARGENDLTYRLLNIMRKNIALNKSIDKMLPPHVVHERFEAVQHAVSCYLDNDKVGVKRRSANRREYTSLAGRIKGKEGTMRGHCMGKRVNQSGRCVITGDNRLKLSEIGIPISIANILTKPIQVTDANIAVLRQSMAQMRYAILPNGSRLDLATHKNTVIRVGWTLEQSLQNGDIVLFNRQPSLHKMSIMAHYVRILPHNTLRFNVACTTPYNADFDGDEMNIHVPQTIEAQAEAAEIMAVKYQVVSPQASRPVISVVQDTMLGAYLLSGAELNRYDAFQVTQCAIDPPYTGLRIISSIIPKGIWYYGCVDIEDGVVLRGRFRKKDLGSSSGSLIHIMFNDAGPQATIDFIWELEQYTARYLHIRGFTVGLNDLKRSTHLSNLCALEREQAFQDVRHMDEMQTNARLNQSRDIMGAAAMSEIQEDNQFYSMIYCGSKGSTVNITQIQACIGQQNVQGKRITKDWTDRTMTCFPQHDDTPQSRGYIQHTYLEGLSPSEMYFCAMAGREGLIDTAIKTAQTGYVARRLMKCLENVVAHADGSARDGQRLLQFQYGDDGRDAMRVETQWAWGKQMQVAIPVHRIAQRHGRDPVYPTNHYVEGDTDILNIKDNPLMVAFLKDHTHNPSEPMLQDIQDHWLKAKVAPGEAVGAVAAQSIGERATQCTLNSVDYNEHLMIQGIGTCVGEYIDRLCDPNGPDTQYVTVKGRKALTIDQNGEVSWNKLIAVTRHLPQNKDGSDTLLKITTQSGRTLTCTKAKSFLVFKNGFVPCSGDEIAIGDRLPLLNNVPSLYRREILDGAMVGTFLATGHIDMHMHMSAKYPQYLRKATKYKHRMHNNDIIIMDPDIVHVFAQFKPVPKCTIGATDEFAAALVHAFIAHNGTMEEHLMVYAPTHHKLLGLMLSQLGIYTTLTSNSVVIPRDQLCVLAHPMFKGDTHFEYNSHNGAWLDTVVKIEEVPSSHKYVYDLTVDKTKNMVLLNGIAIRDTFHFAGVSAKNVTLGLPRLEEILNLTKKMKTPLATFKHTQAHHFKYLEIPPATNIHMEDDLSSFWEFPDEGLYQGEPRRIAIHWDDPVELKRVFNEAGLEIAYTEGPDMVCHIYGEADIPKSIGVKGAEWYKMVDNHVETSLTIEQLIGLLPEEVVDTIYSNNIHDMMKTYGIEAARVTILKEIRKILAHYGIDLNVRHLLLLADWMTQTGTLTPMTRYGLKKVDQTQPLKQSTFEEVVGVFTRAAVQERSDPVENVSACILTGKTATMGTTMAHVQEVEQKVVEENLFDDWVAEAVPAWYAPESQESYAPESYAPESPSYAPESPSYAPESPV